MKLISFISLLLFSFLLNAQTAAFQQNNPVANKWVDSVFNTLSKKERVAQLMIIRAHSNLGEKHVAEVSRLIAQYNIGGLCFFQGGPVRQANLTNYYQSIAKTPLLITIDAEWGLGMRLDSVLSLPRQMQMGAMPNNRLVYAAAKVIAQQCNRMGIHVNFAPVVDVNNNPANPVINDRSFGENVDKVTNFGLAYVNGLQDHQILACLKHFPGHGDVAVDSHYDLPVINKSLKDLNQLELKPFKRLFDMGAGSAMIAHLYIPSIDQTPNLATSLSEKNVTGLLKNNLQFDGLAFTDALEMQGVTKFFKAGSAALQALKAGNDFLCLPGEVEKSIQQILKALNKNQLSWNQINQSVKKILLAKYHLLQNQPKYIDTAHLVEDLNSSILQLQKEIVEQSATLVKLNNPSLLPIQPKEKIAYISIGSNSSHPFSQQMKATFNADVYFFNHHYDLGFVPMLTEILSTQYQKVIVSIHNLSRRPANQFGFSIASAQLFKNLSELPNAFTILFGNPYALANACNAKNVLVMYEDNASTYRAAIDILKGTLPTVGKLPVTVCETFKEGDGIDLHGLPYNENVQLSNKIDSIVQDALLKKALPGCVVLVAHQGKKIVEKAYGFVDTTQLKAVTTNHVYDLASLTKTSATTVAIMKLYEQGKLSLDDPLEKYLKWTMHSNKASITIRSILLHEAGLVPFIPFYKELLDENGQINKALIAVSKSEQFAIPIAENMYLRKDWADTIQQRIVQSKLTEAGKYVYSDNDFIFLGKIVESISGKTLDQYVYEEFYKPLQMHTTTFLPLNHLPKNQIIPTEFDDYFRHQLLHGYVHDEGAATMGGVAGHAGLFSNANDLSILYQMLLNNGMINGIQLLKPATVKLFTAYQNNTSRRGLGFDKPEQNNSTRKDPYPAKYPSLETFGHTGFTGTCVWADPANDLLFIFLSNRVHPTRNNSAFSQLNLRSKIHDVIYQTVLKY